jgi:hypothetical protein
MQRNAEGGLFAEPSTLKSFPLLVLRLLSLRHKITGDPWSIKPFIPGLALRRDDPFIANRSDFNILHGFRKGNFLGKANSLTPVALENNSFDTSHSDAFKKEFII